MLGKEHPSTAATYNNMANVYYSQGDYPKSLEFYEKALKIAEKVLGKEHPKTNITFNNLAITYEKSGNPQPFEEWLKEQMQRNDNEESE